MHLGIDINTGLVFEGLSVPETPSLPPPSVTLAKLIESDADWKALPHALNSTPAPWIFREDSFDPVTRTRRGRLYEPTPGAGQPNNQNVAPHPYEDPTMRSVGRGGRVTKSMHTFSACVPLLNKPGQGQGMTIALGSARAASAWRIIQTEVVVSGAVMVTLKSLSSFALLPRVDYDRIEERFRPAARAAIERVLDSAFRESAISVVDHCRAALTVLISRWLVQEGLPDSTLGLDLGDLAKKLDEPAHALGCASRVSQVVARLHSRGKPNEQHSKSLRHPVDGDAEFAMQAVALTLREFGWAID